MGMPQTTYAATATAVGIRCHCTALLTKPAIGIQRLSNLWLHEEQLHALKTNKRTTNTLKLARSDTVRPHLLTESPQPQSAVYSTAQLHISVIQPLHESRASEPQLPETNRCKRQTQFKFNLCDSSAKTTMATQPQLICHSRVATGQGRQAEHIDASTHHKPVGISSAVAISNVNVPSASENSNALCFTTASTHRQTREGAAAPNTL